VRRVAASHDGRFVLRRSAEVTGLYALDVTTGHTSLLLDGSKAVIPGEKPRPLPLAAASWLSDGTALVVPCEPLVDGEVYLAPVATAANRTR